MSTVRSSEYSPLAGVVSARPRPGVEFLLSADKDLRSMKLKIINPAMSRDLHL